MPHAASSGLPPRPPAPVPWRHPATGGRRDRRPPPHGETPPTTTAAAAARRATGRGESTRRGGATACAGWSTHCPRGRARARQTAAAAADRRPPPPQPPPHRRHPLPRLTRTAANAVAAMKAPTTGAGRWALMARHRSHRRTRSRRPPTRRPASGRPPRATTSGAPAHVPPLPPAVAAATATGSCRSPTPVLRRAGARAAPRGPPVVARAARQPRACRRRPRQWVPPPPPSCSARLHPHARRHNPSRTGLTIRGRLPDGRHGGAHPRRGRHGRGLAHRCHGCPGCRRHRRRHCHRCCCRR